MEELLNSREAAGTGWYRWFVNALIALASVLVLWCRFAHSVAAILAQLGVRVIQTPLRTVSIYYI
jgi:hypothetical protein